MIARTIMRDEIARASLDYVPANYVFPGEYGYTRTLNAGLRGAQMVYSRMLTHLQGGSTATALDETVACVQGGTVTYASPAGAASFNGMFSNCGITANERVNGSMQLSGFKTNYAYNTYTRVVMHARLTAIDSVRTVTIEGDKDNDIGCLDPSGCTYNPGAAEQQWTRLAYTDGVESVVTSVPNALSGAAMGGAVNRAFPNPLPAPLTWPLSPYGALPQSGSAEYTGANNSRLRITVLTASSNPGPHVKIEADANGDGQYEFSLSESWSGLLN